jgi:hypothetical protein
MTDQEIIQNLEKKLEGLKGELVEAETIITTLTGALGVIATGMLSEIGATKYAYEILKKLAEE